LRVDEEQVEPCGGQFNIPGSVTHAPSPTHHHIGRALFDGSLLSGRTLTLAFVDKQRLGVAENDGLVNNHLCEVLG
jgi:hypothetical protein